MSDNGGKAYISGNVTVFGLAQNVRAQLLNFFQNHEWAEIEDKSLHRRRFGMVSFDMRDKEEDGVLLMVHEGAVLTFTSSILAWLRFQSGVNFKIDSSMCTVETGYRTQIWTLSSA
jgi:hypothetical protein